MRTHVNQKKIYAKELDIDLASGREDEYFKWFLACLLFGKPIQQEVAKRAYLELVKEDIVTPEAILKAGWDKLVEVLDRGHYVRYDFSTATKLLDVAKALKEKYGTLAALLKQSETIEELSSRLQEFKGVGPKTVEIFLRDMAPVLKK
jgi:endonuclease III